MKKIQFPDKYGLTQAVVDGRKTQTRKIIHECVFRDSKGGGYWAVYLRDDFPNPGFEDIHGYWHKPEYREAEVVAVAQSYRDAGLDPNMVLRMPVSGRTEILDCQIPYTAGWTNKMFVRADLMPHNIRITNIRIERLQDISAEDCIKEGILYSDKYAMPYGYCDNKCPNGVFFNYSNPREAYADLIDKISGKGTWENNPFVWVYEFELFDCRTREIGD